MNRYFACWLLGGLTGGGAREPTPSPLQGGEREEADETKQFLAACDCHSLVHGLQVHPILEVETFHEPAITRGRDILDRGKPALTLALSPRRGDGGGAS